MKPNPSKTPITVLTGFLGSGKTTLLNRLIKEPALANSLVIINEFGAVGLDHDLIELGNEDDTIIEMSSGCLCCTINGDLRRTLKDASRLTSVGSGKSIERVIIETTGLADPAPIISTIVSDNTLQDLYFLSDVVTIVDATNGTETIEVQEEAAKQAAVADTLLISKTDLIDPADLEKLTSKLRGLNPTADILSMGQPSNQLLAPFTGARFNPEAKSEQVLEWLREEANERHGHDHHHHEHAHDINRHDKRISSVSLAFEEPMPAQVFDEWLGLLTMMRGKDMLRVKGVIHLTEMEKPLVIHGVQHIWHTPKVVDHWPKDDKRSRIVFILRDMQKSDLQKALDFAIERCKGAQIFGEVEAA